MGLIRGCMVVLCNDLVGSRRIGYLLASELTTKERLELMVKELSRTEVARK